MTKFRRLKLSPIERGWSGTKMPGRSIGAPDPVGEGNEICKQTNAVHIFLNFIYKFSNTLLENIHSCL